MQPLIKQIQQTCESFYEIQQNSNDNINDWVKNADDIKYLASDIWDIVMLQDEKPAVYLLDYNDCVENDSITLGVLLQHKPKDKYISAPTLEYLFYNYESDKLGLNTLIILPVIDSDFIKNNQDDIVLLVDYVDFLTQKLAEDEAKNPTPTSTKTNTKEDSKDVVAQLSIVAKQLTLYPYDKTKNTKIKVPDSSLVRNQIACYNKRTELQKTQANKLVIKSKSPSTALVISDKSSGSIQKIYNMSKIIIRKFKK